MIFWFAWSLLALYIVVTELWRLPHARDLTHHRSLAAQFADRGDRARTLTALQDDVDVPLAELVERAEAAACRDWAANEGRAAARDERNERRSTWTSGGVVLRSAAVAPFPPPWPLTAPGQTLDDGLAECRDRLNLIRAELESLDTSDEAQGALADQLIGRYHTYERRYEALLRHSRPVTTSL